MIWTILAVSAAFGMVLVAAWPRLSTPTRRAHPFLTAIHDWFGPGPGTCPLCNLGVERNG